MMDSNLEKELKLEIERNKEILKQYESIPQGIFAATLIKHSIKFAQNALGEGNLVHIIQSLKDLRENKD